MRRVFPESSRGRARPFKRFCPPLTHSPHADLSHPPSRFRCAANGHLQSLSVWQSGDASSFLSLLPVPSSPAARMIGDTFGSLPQPTDPVLATFQFSTSVTVDSFILTKDAIGFPSWWTTSPPPDLLDTPTQYPNLQTEGNSINRQGKQKHACELISRRARPAEDESVWPASEWANPRLAARSHSAGSGHSCYILAAIMQCMKLQLITCQSTSPLERDVRESLSHRAETAGIFLRADAFVIVMKLGTWCVCSGVTEFYIWREYSISPWSRRSVSMTTAVWADPDLYQRSY
ncbi:hypothetical protein G5714_014449 [Onychostoma macrolepis]|uniref:Uncharacterized protein n=1 Tax=Onychostoma macrolepis TaxID=369639 RepID=A0A7J6CCU0_9TELE|nr:hypothetical protein G5714_014449 [Onychostoma macrolepis]